MSKRPTHYRARPKAPTPAAVSFALAFYSRPKPDPLSRDSNPAEPAAESGGDTLSAVSEREENSP